MSDHSRYREDPLGRLTRTAAYITATAFGAEPEVEQAVGLVRRRHGPVTGTSDRGLALRRRGPRSRGLGAQLADRFLPHRLRAYGAEPCPAADADRYVSEQTQVGALLGADPLPETADALTAWIADTRTWRPRPAPGRRSGSSGGRRCPGRSARPTACCTAPPRYPAPAHLRDHRGSGAAGGSAGGPGGRHRSCGVCSAPPPTGGWPCSGRSRRASPGARFRQPLPVTPSSPTA